MNFKVGDRVRILSTPRNDWQAEGVILRFIGNHTTYDGEKGVAWRVAIFGYRSGERDGSWNVLEPYMRPLTDPRADAFIESIKKLAREPRLPVTTPAFGD